MEQCINESYLCNLTMSILNNHVPSYFCQIFAQSEHLCAKLLHQDCNDAHRWKGQPKNEHDKKRTFHTNTHHQNNAERTLHMSGTHLPIFAQLQQLWLEFYSTNIDPNCQKSQKTRGLHWENKQQKLSWEPISLYLAYNMTPRLLYRTPPLCHPILALCPPLWRCTLCQEHDPRQQGSDNNKRGRLEVFVCPPTNLYWDFSRYNKIFIIQHFSVFSLSIFLFKIPSDNINFYSTVFYLVFLFFFSSFFGFFWTTSFTFSSLSIFVSIS